MALAAVVLIGLGVAATGLSQLVQIRLTQAVNANWRGAYDILVTPRSHSVTTSASETSGLIEPDFLDYAGHGGISFAQLAQIRRLAGVALAAPEATVGYLTSDKVAPDIYLSKNELPRAPTLYRLTLRVSTSDGLHAWEISSQTLEALLGPASLTGSRVPFLSSVGNFGWDPSGVTLAFDYLPPQVTPVVAVDPIAEEQLLGPSLGFLHDLSVPSGQLRVSTFPLSRIPSQFWYARDMLGSLQPTGSGQPSPAAREPVVPIVVSDRLSYPLQVSVSIDRVGRPLTSYPSGSTPAQELATAMKDAGSAVTPVGTASLNATDELRGFEPPSLTLLWPGSSPPNGTSLPTQEESRLDTELAQRATYTSAAGAPDGAVPGYRIQPLGKVGFDGEPATQGEGTTQSYRRFISYPLAIQPPAGAASGGETVAQSFFLAPVGTFDLSRLDLPGNPLNHVPLGAYEAAGGTSLSSPSAGRLVTPTANPLGFLTSPPEVMTSISEARLLRGQAPIDAIRVRVSGVSTFDAQARSKVAAVASRIANLGLDVRIVAGSSPRTVDVFVPDYYSNGKPLGWVREEWTSLGAAQSARASLSTGEWALLLLSLSLALLLAVAVSSVHVRVSTRDVRIWTTLGWGRGRMLWWLVSDAAMSALAIGAASALIGILRGRPGVPVAVGIGLAVVLVATQCVFALWILHGQRRDAAGSPNRRRHRPWRAAGHPPGGSARFALRAVSRQPQLSCLVGLGMTLSVIAVGVALGALQTASRSAGTSLLGSYLTTQLRGFHIGLIALLAVGGPLATAIATQEWHRRRRPEVRALAAAGWTIGRVRTELRTERVLIAVTATVVALGGAAALGALGVGTGGILILPTAVALGAAYLVVSEWETRRFVGRTWRA